jgi:acyl-CoA thioesterase
VSAFIRDTAVEEVGGGGFRGHVSADWFTPRGANGGFLAAIMLRAIIACEQENNGGPASGGHVPASGTPLARAPRSLTLHYLRPPTEGEVRIVVTEERRGRQLTTYSARMEQDGRVCVLALAALSNDFAASLNYAKAMPDVTPPNGLKVRDDPHLPAITHRLATQPAIGHAPFSGGDEALTGGWIAFAGDEPSPLDSPALALLTDAWLPSPFVLVRDFVGVPTIDLTIHFRARSEGRTGPALAIFSSRTSAEGFFEEDGELWSEDGTLLAQSRQLGLVLA